ncbi:MULTISPECIES: universal stress protein [unclassified Polaribacter]|uniref:universal stress protein n=1 Tax=unclassified Polaribacter TaxID=196858 RepID=UPI0011BE7DEC|nr:MULTISPECIES: universal stress protein [unclassified Polaribacter]TXD51985.1 universal stress protein [Polaribacter sp. IC063]TXD58654.1 universal stress protein [Polaribacter sp. IC066]
MKTILVPTDFSENAYSALFYAAKLFEDEPCCFIILNSFEDQVFKLVSPVYIGKSDELMNSLLKASEVECLAEKNKLISDLGTTKHTFKIISTSLLLTRAINELIVKEKVNFVAMGSKGKTATEHLFIGSNSFKVAENIKGAPLLIIPDKIAYKVPKKLGFASGFKKSYSNKQLEPLKEIHKLFSAKTKVIYVFEEEKLPTTELENLQALLQISKNDDFELQWLSETESKANTIMEYVYKEKLDMLAICYYKHNFISNLFRENVVKEITHNIRTPLLILPSTD